ncbi:MAG TPA: hypothetical protein VJM31_00975 [Vicinamibacterales bacterium]|nr:hypothetical protein [Vicinamibacterales bacterium]
MAAAKRISVWGIASLVLTLGTLGLAEYNLYLYDHAGRSLIRFTDYYQICVVVQLAAAVCGHIAMRRGSKWWVLAALPALLLAVLCFFSEL